MAVLSFNVGDAFPADNPIAIFLMALSTALNDLVLTARWMAGGSKSEPRQFALDQAEQFYLLRLSFVQLHELRETVKHARKDPVIDAFLRSLGASAQEKLTRLETINTSEADWIRKSVEYVRNQTVHYGGKWGWDETRWALGQIEGAMSSIEILNPTLAGFRIKVADDIAARPLMRYFPEYRSEPTAAPNDEVLTARLETLFDVVGEVVIVAQDFVLEALVDYIDHLPPDVITNNPD